MPVSALRVYSQYSLLRISSAKGCDKKFDIGFLHDVSESTASHFELAKKFILSLVSTFRISQAATRTSYLAFSTNPDVHLAAFNMHNSYADFEKNIKTTIKGGKFFLRLSIDAFGALSYPAFSSRILIELVFFMSLHFHFSKVLNLGYQGTEPVSVSLTDVKFCCVRSAV